MENTIFLPLLILALIQIDFYVQHPNNLKSSITLGIIFGLLIWSRSDSVLFVLIALSGIVIFLLRKFGVTQLRHFYPFILIIAITFIFGVGYLFFNFYAAGSIFSVSGVVKMGDSTTSSWLLSKMLDALRVHLSMIWDQFNDLAGLTWWGFNWRIFPFKIITIIWIAVVIVWWIFYFINKSWRVSSNSKSEARIGLYILIIYTLIHTLILITLLRSMLDWTPWYIVPQVLTVLVIIPLVLFPRRLLDQISGKARTIYDHYIEKRIQPNNYSNYSGIIFGIGGLLLFLAILGPSLWALSVPIRNLHRDVESKSTLEPRFELAMWLNDHIPASSKVGMFDSGLTGYFSQAKVINLDGLVNSPGYVAIRRSGKIADYIIKNKFEYLIYYYFPPHKMNWWFPTDDSKVCYKLIHVNKYPAPWWGAENVNNYFEVVALRYDGKCEESWLKGFPSDAIPPQSE